MIKRLNTVHEYFSTTISHTWSISNLLNIEKIYKNIFRDILFENFSMKWVYDNNPKDIRPSNICPKVMLV